MAIKRLVRFRLKAPWSRLDLYRNFTLLAHNYDLWRLT